MASFQMFDDLARLHNDQARLKWVGDRSATKLIEGFYTDRLIRWLESEGLGPVKKNGPNAPVDLVVNGLEVEVKIAIARSRPRPESEGSGVRPEFYQALLWEPKTGSRRGRRVLNGSIVIVVCVDPSDRLWPFVIPRDRIGSRRTVEITSSPARYRGRWAPFLGAFDYLRGNDNGS